MPWRFMGLWGSLLLRPFLTSPVDRGDGFTARPAVGGHWIGWVGSKYSLDAMGKTKILRMPGIDPRYAIIQAKYSQQ